MNDFLAAHRQRQANRIGIVASLVCALGCAAALIPGVELAVTLVLGGGAALTLVLLGVRLVRRWLRERREDRADALTAAAWRAENARSHVARPHALDNVPLPSGRGVS